MSTAPVLQTTIKMHAHRCEACAKKGEEVVWIHPEQDVGQVASHRCPKCGEISWKQSAIDNAKLPQPLPRNATAKQVNFDTLLGYIILLVGLSILAYGIYVYYSDRKSKNELANLSPAGVAGNLAH